MIDIKNVLNYMGLVGEILREEIESDRISLFLDGSTDFLQMPSRLINPVKEEGYSLEESADALFDSNELYYAGGVVAGAAPALAAIYSGDAAFLTPYAAGNGINLIDQYRDYR